MQLSIQTNPSMTPLCLCLLGLIPLCAAWYTQYALGYHPCHLCMLQRYPYALMAALGVVACVVRPLRMRPHVLWRLAALCLCATGLIACYHVGIEQGWIIEKGGCSAPDITATPSLEVLRARLLQAPLVACNVVSLKILGLSIASYNGALGLSGAIFCMIIAQKMGEKRRI